MNIISAIRNLINLAKMTRGSNGSYQITVLDGETIDNVQYMQPFGFKGEPPKDSNALLASRAGNKNAGVILVIENDSGAIALSEGETVIYNNHGVTIHLKSNGEVEVDGDLTATGDVSDSNATTPTMISIRTQYNLHTHNETGSVTGPPIQQM